jgi:HTH-type transcriptional regulator/antitoxin HigA
MRVIAKKILREFWERHNHSEEQLKIWYKEASKAVWRLPADIKAEYARASILKDNRVVFNICGNKYRLVVEINYIRQWVFIQFIGTHRDYDEIDVNKYRLMHIKVIKTEEDYNQAIKKLEEIFQAPIDTKEGDEADLLSLLIEKYEDEHYPIEAPDPIEAIKFRMEQMNMTKKELAEIIGYKSRVSEIFSRKRKLTLKMIRNLHEKLKIPYESLITDY